jgi:hypothetical protein
MADVDDAQMSPRERRRSRAASHKPSGTSVAWKRYRVHLVIVLVLAAILTAMVVNARDTKDCPGHWHSTMDVYVNGQRVSFKSPKYDLNGGGSGGSMGLSIHMHQPDDAMLHWEPQGAIECIPFREALSKVDMELTSTQLVLDGAHEQLGLSGTFKADAQHNLTAWHRVGDDGSWEKVSISKVLSSQQQRGERLLIVYGNETEAQLAPYQAKADGNNIQQNSEPAGVSYVPVIGVSIMGLVALAVWHALSRKL